MLGDKDAIATLGVKNLEAARDFYEGKLGLKPAGPDEPGTLSYKSGSSAILVYESQFAGTNQATAVTWIVGEDVQGMVQALKTRGITFEHYDLPDTTREGDVHLAGHVKVAWFKDPDGNIHSLVNGQTP
jgi:catechol 2,3-dioxygenase-like lactoylglutathione lyase family enzyme